MQESEQIGRPVPPRRGQVAKHASVLDAAAAVFCRDGFAGASIDLIAAEAGVSRQTIYNHHGDKEALFVAVVREMTERCNAGLFSTLTTFPDRPRDLEAEMTAFAGRLVRNCLYNRDGGALRKLIQSEGERYPALFAAWREHGPGTAWAAIAARFARLAHAGYLRIEDPDLAARQFLALIHADFHISHMLGTKPAEAEIDVGVTNAVRTFLRAFGPTAPPPPALAQRTRPN
ncbi:TetR/AcrR family transcriptional regulator [Inquilinus sp. CA228]|uniref:TetR/AcrR family transcriptional regulator n=1 Tax=Inquilinus sp. CA228 TaxID=3455609 RepID=UPI003F8D2003